MLAFDESSSSLTKPLGYPDYLCVGKNGSVRLWQNQANLADQATIWFADMGFVKNSEGFDRSEIRFADIDGNGKFSIHPWFRPFLLKLISELGRHDYLAVNRYDGSIMAWTSGNTKLNSAGIYNWTARGIILNGAGVRGENMMFANLGGYGRADFVAVDPATGDASVGFNVCPQLSAGRESRRPDVLLVASLAMMLFVSIADSFS